MNHTTADTAARILAREGGEMTLVRLSERVKHAPRVKGRPENKTPENVARALRDDPRFVVTGHGQTATVRFADDPR